MENTDWPELVHTCSKDLLRLAYSYLKNTQEAEDSVQEAFLKAVSKNMQFENMGHAKAWLARSTINICKNKLRSPWHKKRISLEEPGIGEAIQTSPSASPEEKAIQNDRDIQLLETVMSLPEKYREVIVLYYLEEYPVPEIAKIPQKSISTITTRLQRGRKKLLEAIERKDYYDRT